MPAVFVHGNPETSAIWGPLVDALARDDVICLSPPGFGAPLPVGFAATGRAYVDWLIAELEAIDGPIDLVGHDWGGGHVVGAVMENPRLVQTWAVDVLGLFHPDYVWHDAAQVWQTPTAGEELVSQMFGASLADKVAMFESLGMETSMATKLANGTNEETGTAVLALYRSATRADLDTAAAQLHRLGLRPGLAIVATEDTYVGGPSLVAELANHVGAATAELRGCGHWWMLDQPGAAAAMLERFWTEAPASTVR